MFYKAMHNTPLIYYTKKKIKNASFFRFPVDIES